MNWMNILCGFGVGVWSGRPVRMAATDETRTTRIELSLPSGERRRRPRVAIAVASAAVGAKHLMG
jgi:hypothetical protein